MDHLNKNIKNVILNVKPSPDDKRDFIFSSHNYNNIENKPTILDLRSELNPIRNQGLQGTCYAQSAACMKEWQEKRDYNLNEYLSPQFFYNNRFNVYDNDKNNDEGMFGRDVMKLLKNVGICYEKNYPYGLIEKKDQIKNELYEEASKHKIKAYARIYTVEDLKESLFKNGPCLIAFPAYNSYSEFWKPLYANQELEGGHAVTVVGYLEDCFIIRNSWGSDWGENGYCYYKFKDWGAHWEIWTTIDEKTINELQPKPEPEPQAEREVEAEVNPNINNIDKLFIKVIIYIVEKIKKYIL